MKKKFFAVLLAAAAFTVNAAAVNLYIDTAKIATDTPPTVVSGRTLVPVRPIFESLGATVSWDQNTQTATGVKDNTTVKMQISNTTAYINGEPKTLDVPAQLINGRTMVPARFVSEALHCDVTWHPETQTAAVAYKLKDQHLYVSDTGNKYHFDNNCNGGTYYEATLAEVMGRALTPCEKCINSPAPAAPASTPATPPATTAPATPATPAPQAPAPSANVTPAPQVPQTSVSNSSRSTVYITRTGKHYHYSSSCGRGKYFEATLQEALSRGLTPCSKCAK